MLPCNKKIQNISEINNLKTNLIPNSVLYSREIGAIHRKTAQNDTHKLPI